MYLVFTHHTGFDANTLLKSDWTGLMYASDGGHEAAVKLLLSYGANPNYIKGTYAISLVKNSNEYLTVYL